MSKPIRIQLSRAKGWRMPENTLSVARPTRWGNPFKAGSFRDYSSNDSVDDFKRWLARDFTIRSAENVFGKPPSNESIKALLRGKNLACWCKLGDACHADTLLEIANTEAAP